MSRQSYRGRGRPVRVAGLLADAEAAPIPRTPIEQIRDRLAAVGVRHGLPVLPWARELANGLAMALPEARTSGLSVDGTILDAIHRRRDAFGMPLGEGQAEPLACAIAAEWDSCVADGLTVDM